MMKPFRVFLFFLLLILGVTGIFLLMPDDGVQLYSFRIRNPVRLWIQSNFSGHLHRLTPAKPLFRDTIPVIQADALRVTRKESFKDSLMKFVPSVEYPDHVAEQWRSLLHYYAGLKGMNKTSHILHYGDSQIEGDRITSVLRDSLQRWFGGGGPGLFLPVMTVPVTSTIRISADNTWRKEAVDLINAREHLLPPVGIFLEHCIFPGEEQGHAFFRVTVQHFALPLAGKINRFRIFYYGDPQECILTVESGKNRQSFPLSPNPSLKQITGNLRGFQGTVNFDMDAEERISIEGVSLEGGPGILLDNIPLRGRTMVAFSKADTAFMRCMIDSLNVRLVLFQFGLNSVAGGEQGITAFEKQFRYQLGKLREICPEVLTLVVGTTDMGREGIRTDTLSERLREIQRKVAFDEGCLFWDSYRAMGGRGSAKRWYTQDPQLIRPDYVHLSMAGSRFMASMLAKALYREIISAGVSEKRIPQ